MERIVNVLTIAEFKTQIQKITHLLNGKRFMKTIFTEPLKVKLMAFGIWENTLF